jgi:hypothetical protein
MLQRRYRPGDAAYDLSAGWRVFGKFARQQRDQSSSLLRLQIIAAQLHTPRRSSTVESSDYTSLFFCRSKGRDGRCLQSRLTRV